MLTFKELRSNLTEAFRPPSGEKVVKTFKVGKKSEAVITQKGGKFIAYVDGDKLDEFKSAKEAEKSTKEFADLMGA